MRFLSITPLRRIVAMALVAVFALAVAAPAGVWAKEYMKNGGGGVEGDPTDGHDFSGGGGGLFDDPPGSEGMHNRPVRAVAVSVYFGIPIAFVDGMPVLIWVEDFYGDIEVYDFERGGIK